ncbi:MAG TPA: alpha-glucan family phosphorylase [Patescibacteria group bacterium]|nr:alpha-glucan family phosphorylase [Patescibacteria group bacterium]
MSEIKISKNKIKENNPSIAYFSMEIGLESDIKTYAGGLGVLAGDILFSAASLKVPMLGVTLLSKYGYFKQKINKKGEQEEHLDNDYNFSKLKKIKAVTNIKLGKDEVKIRAWLYEIKSSEGFIVPVYLLDTDVEGNKKEHRILTNNLYGGGKDWRLLQEVILGRGGYEVLKKLGHKIKKFHINEGHGSFVAIAKFLDIKEKIIRKKIKLVKEACVFTTHTPVKEAHDVFKLEKVMACQEDFPSYLPNLIKNKKVNMTEVGMYFSGYINSVAISHNKVTKKMFPEYKIRNVTNGVNIETWASLNFKKLFDKYIPSWRKFNLLLKDAKKIPLDKLWQAHQGNKEKLISLIKKKTKKDFKEDIFTIGFARRFTSYKRPSFLLKDINRLLEIQSKVGKIQIVFAGKAHPQDKEGKAFVLEVNKIAKQYSNKIKIVFIPGYEIDLAKVIISGVDLWLNNPLPPNEASGTSGMKAACNGVPQLSTYDGWWVEGYKKDKTGWLIGNKKKTRNEGSDSAEVDSMYDILESTIIPTYYKNLPLWQKIMRSTISLNASYFNTQRALKEYAKKAYLIKL